MKVYLVYDSYIENLEVIFSSNEKAQQYIEENGFGDYEIDEWELDKTEDD